MIEDVMVKVCGLATLEGARAAAEAGADVLGFNFYPQSPRYLSLEKFEAMAGDLPPGRKIAVLVEPPAGELAALRRAGFDSFQIHFRIETPESQLAGWSEAAGPSSLWLAPKLPPGADIAAGWLRHAHYFLLDAYQADRFGGTGHTGDWKKFAQHHARHPDKGWILAGGLNPENIGAALHDSGARFVDVNSGVESAPGIKDAKKLRAFAAAVRKAVAERKA